MSGEYLNEARDKNVDYADAKGFVSPLLHVGQFKLDCKKSLSPYELDISNPTLDREAIAEKLGADLEMVAELEQVCSPSNLTTKLETKLLNWDDPMVLPNSIGLQTIKQWKEKNRQRNQQVVKARYTEYQCEKEASLRDLDAKHPDDKIRGVESVITIGYYFTRTKRKWRTASLNIRVLGSQKLTELKDALPCEFGQQPIGDFTNNPNLSKNVVCQDIVKSGFFYIENTFYNDCRDVENIDISSYIMDWAKSSGYKTDDCKFAKMEDVTFDDLELRLGAPYLFWHMGDCEHIIMFKDIRLIHVDDCLSRSEYPIHLSRPLFKSPTCTVCSFFYATWVTRNDELVDEDPAYFCDTCFKMLHYNNGEKVGSFEAYPHICIYTMDYPNPNGNKSNNTL